MRVALFAASRPHYRTAVALARLADAHSAWTSLLLDALAPRARQSLAPPPPCVTQRLLPALPGEEALAVLLRAEHVDALLVFGGGEAALNAAHAAARTDIPLIHMEAGQRPASPDARARHARLDAKALLRCCLSRHQARALEAEGVHEGVCVVGDPLYDLFQDACSTLDPNAAARWGVTPQGFVLAVTDSLFHNTSPLEQKTRLDELSRWGVASALDILLLSDTLHTQSATPHAVELAPRLRLLPPLPPADLLSLACACRCLFTDSDSLQREALYAGKRAILPSSACAGQLVAPLENGWHRAAPACTAETLTSLSRLLATSCPHPGLPEGAGWALRRMLAAVMATLADRADGLL